LNIHVKKKEESTAAGGGEAGLTWEDAGTSSLDHG